MTIDNNSRETVLTDHSNQPEIFADFLAKRLNSLGIEVAFGISGGGVSRLWMAIEHSDIPFIHCRHEAGASFAATESFFETNSPALVLTTSGPGITNSLTGLFAAKFDGAKLVLLSGYTAKIQRGKGAVQETTPDTLLPGLFEKSALFDYVMVVESIEQWPVIERQLAAGFAKPGGFIAHISIPPEIQSCQILKKISTADSDYFYNKVVCGDEVLLKCIDLIKDGTFAIWVGYGAHEASSELRFFAEKTGCPVFCSPSAKGVFPEEHKQYLGVSGLGGHKSVFKYFEQCRPDYILVLGTSLAETTSFWSLDMTPNKGFIHVDINPKVPGLAYPEVNILGVQSEIKLFLEKLIKLWPLEKSQQIYKNNNDVFSDRDHKISDSNSNTKRVNPYKLFEGIQNILVTNSNTLIMAESGNSFAWATHLLRFSEPNCYRISSLWGSMGHFAAGVIGAAYAKRRKIIAIVGDGAMLMLNEVSTAVQYQIPATWIILNDGCYNMCRHGINIASKNSAHVETRIPPTNFMAIAQAMGANAIRIEKNTDIFLLENILSQNGPYVVDVLLDPNPISPFRGRIDSLSQHSAFPE